MLRFVRDESVFKEVTVRADGMLMDARSTDQQILAAIGSRTERNALCARFNTTASQLASSCGIGFVDLMPLVIDSTGELDERFNTHADHHASALPVAQFIYETVKGKLPHDTSHGGIALGKLTTQ